MSNKNVFVKKDYFTKFDDLKFGFQAFEDNSCSTYLYTTNCADLEEIKPISETLLEIWDDICVKWVDDNLDKEGYALCFDTTWDQTGVDDVRVSLPGSLFYTTEERPSLELLRSRIDEIAEGAFNLSLDFIDEIMSYLEQPAHCFAEPLMEIPSKSQVKEYTK
ncbi:MAG: hypothetical protein ACYTBW_01315 [Planctomycetota bacterium]|jgi:hypothetical protein